MRLKLAVSSDGVHLWAIWLPGALAVVMAALFAVIDLVGVVMGSWDTPVHGLGWLRAGAYGQCGLGVAAIAVLVAGVTHPGWRHDAALAAWGVIALEAGWFLLTRMLVNP